MPKSRLPAGLDASIVGCLLRRCSSLILAEGCNTNIWCGVIGKPPTWYFGCWADDCWAVAALVALRMTTAAVKAAAITFKIRFFMDHPRVGVGFSIFNMQRTGPTVSRVTDGVDSHQRQLGPISAAGYCVAWMYSNEDQRTPRHRSR